MRRKVTNFMPKMLQFNTDKSRSEFSILFYVFIAQMNPRFLKVVLVDLVFIT